jgi:competence protein ComEC
VSRIDRDSLIYRDTDDPCDDGRRICTISLTGGAKLHILAPPPTAETPNDRSVALKLIGPDSASFSMWMAGDAEHREIAWFDSAGYSQNPGMRVDVVKADHHGSCNGVTPEYLALTHPRWVVVSVGAVNDYGHMHTQAKNIYRKAGVPWLRTDENGTLTIRSTGIPGRGFTVTPDHTGTNLNGTSDKGSRQDACKSAR